VIVTDIKRQVKRADRYAIYGDKRYIFSLSEAGLLASGLHIGQEIDEAALYALQADAARDKLYDRALQYIAIRLRSQWEVAQYLKRKQAAADDQAYVLERLAEHHWLDDAAFATAWVNTRRQLRLTTRMRLRQELRAKHVADAIIERVLRADETDEQTVLQALVAQKRRQSRYQDNLKLMQYLVRQGFSYEAVKQAVRSESDEDEA
jgi:regulatory protein